MFWSHAIFGHDAQDVPVEKDEHECLPFTNPHSPQPEAPLRIQSPLLRDNTTLWLQNNLQQALTSRATCTADHVYPQASQFTPPLLVALLYYSLTPSFKCLNGLLPILCRTVQ